VNLWFPEDVRRMLASQAVVASRYGAGEYRAGYMDALRDLAISFGLDEREGLARFGPDPVRRLAEGKRGG